MGSTSTLRSVPRLKNTVSDKLSLLERPDEAEHPASKEYKKSIHQLLNKMLTVDPAERLHSDAALKVLQQTNEVYETERQGSASEQARRFVQNWARTGFAEIGWQHNGICYSFLEMSVQ